VGSVAEKVIRLADRDVLVIGSKSTHAGLASIRSVLVPLDGSKAAEAALPRAREFADLFGATMRIMRVVPPPVAVSEGARVGAAPLDALTRGAGAYLETVGARTGGVEAVPPAVGPVADTIADYVEGNNVDLVVLTSYGAGGFVGGAVGGVPTRLIGGPAPVLIVNAGGQ
jgi:nucleotide-binding universal stress UspA family protein